MTTPDAEPIRLAIVDHSRRMATSVTAAEPGAPVPTTPEWTVAELVKHMGQTQNWVAEIIERRIVDPTELPVELVEFPEDPDSWTAWLSESARRAANACSDEALTAPVLNAAGDERSGTEFWMSSLLSEAVIHGYDAANAAGSPFEVDPDIAAAIISSHFAMLTSPTWTLQRPDSATALRGTSQTLQWVATDTTEHAGAWHVERRPDGARWQPGRHAADVTVSGPAGSLLLTLTRRTPLSGVTVEGNTALAQHWLEHTAHVTN